MRGIGGSESNVAVGLARLGHEAQWIGRVGDDVFGRKVVADLAREGVDVRGVVVDHEASTGLMLREDRSALSTTVHYVRKGSAGSRLCPADIPTIAASDHVHVSGITPALGHSSAAALDRAIDRAVAVGASVSFDVNHRASLWTQWEAAPVLRTLAARATVVFASDDELDLIGPGSVDATACATALIEQGVPLVIVKRGRHGATAFHAAGALSVPGIEVPVVDPVGAGDAFVAGYLAAHLEGADFEAALSMAIRAGAYAITVPGDYEGMPSRADLEAVSEWGSMGVHR